ncbi:MAG TPA: ATP-binding protein [Silvibacterium sp.]|nr:ATP-binding protein [Silvibacterium sp.]
MSFLRARSISAKLTWLNLLVTGTALVLACLSFLAYDFLSYRDNLIQNLQAEAQIAGSNSVTALMFDDPQAAEATLTPLRGSPDVVSAAIVAEDGHVFAQYRQPHSQLEIGAHALSAAETKAQWIHGSSVLVGYRIEFSGKSVGVIYIQAHFSELGPRLERYGLTAALILLLCMAAAFLATAAFRRLVTQPITALAGTARIISREKDFSLRAAQAGDQNEIAVLVEAFNDMLHEIQTRDQALREGREMMERRVQERTAELRAANRELEAFSYSVAHDLRGPLDVISGLTFIMQSAYRGKLGKEGAEMMETLQRSTRNMAGLIDDLLNLARATTVGLDRKEIDLTAMARSIAEDVSITSPKRHVDFTFVEGAVVSADEGLMHVVMENLIRNAWKYTSRHSHAEIEFGWTPTKQNRVFYVRDDGAGFDPNKAGKLFRPFQRLHAASEFPGSGIGLATVQRIIERHGGKVWAEGQVEHGATFYFTL